VGIDPKCCAVSEMRGHWHVEGICTLGWLKFLQAARKGGGLTMHDVRPIGMGKQVHGEVLSTDGSWGSMEIPITLEKQRIYKASLIV